MLFPDVRTPDISNNKIATPASVIHILLFVSENLNNLQVLDFSKNQIRLTRDTENVEEFIAALKTVLEMPAMPEVNFSGNPIAVGREMAGYMTTKLGFELAGRIVWKYLALPLFRFMQGYV